MSEYGLNLYILNIKYKIIGSFSNELIENQINYRYLSLL